MKKLLITLMLIASSVLAGTRVETENIVFSNANITVIGDSVTPQPLGYSGNGIYLTGPDTVDRDIVWGGNGKLYFSWQTYRNEYGKYFYLYDYEAEKDILSITRAGRVGINKMNNLLNYHTLSDQMEKSSDLEIDMNQTVYTPNYTLVYKLEITSVNPDTYSIATALSSTSPFTTNSTGHLCSLDSTDIGNGIYVYWTGITGHSVGETRIFYGIPQQPVSTLSVAPTFIDEVMIDTNLWKTPKWVDRTFEANSTAYGTFRPLRMGTNSALYIGMKVPNNAFYINIVTGAVGASLVREYWSGSSWKPVSNVVDSTVNWTKAGDVSFDSGQMSDWTKTNLTVDSYVDQYYWYRVYSTNIITSEPWCSVITRHGNMRMAVLQAPLDDVPAMEVDAAGNTWIGGLPMSAATVQTFYYKFLAQCSTQFTATVASAPVAFTTEVSDVYNVYTNGIWSPNSTSMCRMNWSIRTAGALAAGRGFYVVLFQNGVAVRDLQAMVSGDNADVPVANGTYIFTPPNLTNNYQIGVRRFSGNDVTLAGGNTNWWFGEKIQ